MSKSVTFYVHESKYRPVVVFSVTREAVKNPYQTKLWKQLPQIASALGSDCYGVTFNYDEK